MTRRLAWAFSTLLCACARPQWLVFLGTDAAVPQLGDQVDIAVLDESGALACPDCSRHMTAGARSEWPVSFGVQRPEKGNARLRIRASLYREACQRRLPSLEAVGLLPVGEGLLRTQLVLTMSCFRKPADIAGRRSCDARTGELQAEQPLPLLAEEGQVVQPPGNQEGGPRPGPGEPAPPAGMVYIPAGRFLLGDARACDEGVFASSPEHLVHMRAFFIDRDEFTVRKYHALRVPHPELAEPIHRAAQPGEAWSQCTYPALLDHPLNCLSWEDADAACHSRYPEARLPTEAEWEYVAGNLGAETTYPWEGDGGAEDICSKAIVARGRDGLDAFQQCRYGVGAGTDEGGVAMVTKARDQTGRGVRNLAGNVSEWVVDQFAPYDAPCWNAEGPLDNPSCDQAGLGYSDGSSVRGGNWQAPLHRARVTLRDAVPHRNRPSEIIGFRCVVPL